MVMAWKKETAGKVARFLGLVLTFEGIGMLVYSLETAVEMLLPLCLIALGSAGRELPETEVWKSQFINKTPRKRKR
jgi:hypothetical protein